MTTASWTGPVNGDWTDATKWSSNPAAPINGMPLPADSYDALMTEVGGAYTVHVTSSLTINSITLDSPVATLMHDSGTITLGTLTIQRGTLALQGNSRIMGGTIRRTGGSVRIDTTPGTGGPILFSVNLLADLQVQGGANLRLWYPMPLSGNTFRFDGTNTYAGLDVTGPLTGSGTLLLENGSYTSISADSIDSGVFINATTGGGQIGRTGATSRANIRVQSSGQSIAFYGRNEGTITATGGAAVSMDTFSPSPTVNAGTVTVTGGTFTVGYGQRHDFGWSNTGTLSVSSGCLRLGALPNDFGQTSINNGSLLLKTGLTTSALASIKRVGSSVVIEGNGPPGYLTGTGILTNAGTTLTVGGANGSFILRGGQISGGTIASSDGSSLRAVSAGTVSGGTLSAVTLTCPLDISGGIVSLEGAWRNQSTITLADGTLLLNSTGAQAGVINAAGAIAVSGNWTKPWLGELHRTGGTFVIGGTLNNSNDTFIIDEIGAWRLSGTVSGGTLSSSGTTELRLDGGSTSGSGTLSGVSLGATIRVSNHDVLNVAADLSLLDGARISIGDAGANFDGAATLQTQGNLSITGSGEFVFESRVSDSSSSSPGVLKSAFGTVTIGEGVTVRTGVANGIVGSAASGRIINRGTVSGSTPRRQLQISGTFQNLGRAEASNSGTFLVAGVGSLLNYSNGALTGGTWSVGANSTMTLGTSTITTNNANILLDGVGSTFAPINQLRKNLGLFSISSGRNFSSVGSLTNSGTINIGSLSTLSVRDSIDNASGLIDLNCKMIVDYSGSSPLSDLVNQIGTQIISSAALADPSLAIGSSDDGNLVLLQLTTLGDANLDGAVNYTDLVALSQNYQASSLVGAGWTGGDFNYDGAVNLTDLYALGYQYTDPLHPLPQALESLGLPLIEVPEPGLALLIAGAAWPLFGRAHSRLKRPRQRRLVRD